MASRWERRRLGDVCRISHGYAFAGAQFSNDSSFPTLVTPGNFGVGGGFREAKTKTFKGPIPDGYALSGGDLIVTMTDLSTSGDTLGYSALVPSSGTYLHNQRIGRVSVVRTDLVERDYLYWVMRTAAYRHHVLSTASGSTVRHTSPDRILEFVCPFPPLAEQRRIAGVLGALDDLIEVNRGLIRDLDALRQAACASLLDQARFSVPLSSVARFVNGKNFTKDASGTGRPVVRTPELRQGPNGGTVWNDVEATSDFIARAGDMLFVWSGSLMIDRWIHEEGLVNQHIFKVVPQTGFPDWLVYAQIEYQMPWFLGLAADKATTMGHIQRGHLDAEVPMPSPEALASAASAIGPLWDASLQLSLESIELSRSRDELLPLLMSGRVRVVEEMVA